ncbi:RIPOR family member 3 [Conger conger]|uniref:RIPOR family member 3 n=1 Tax=Conger conger TaxID=82655 RepID=UPI002A5A8EEC|nr:RIPOR family member 3 [Conger conger]
MSVKLRFEYPAESGVVHRSRSFTGFSSLNSHRRVSAVRSSLRSKGTARKIPRIPHSTGRVSSTMWGPQPEQVDRIFQALRKGLKEYLEGHQAEMDFLSSQQKDSRRNSRLAFLYDLEKEIRALERYMRRLEFHVSKVEELYETYCIQWRLCQGAANMKRAFSLSPSSRASRDSLLELTRNHRHGLEDMCIMEGELEILLGELHIKMKGLIGFARLCPGDQYEVLVRLGRQRWKMRGEIQTDDRQSWDEEEMVFLPHIHENFEIKVTEVKGLGSMLVGMVTCESADFFTSQPQIMVVDITELGTIKLQLEVVWNPFDSSEMRPVTSASSKLSVHSRKGSLYSWTPPNTPSFTEKYFISMVKQFQDPDSSFPLIRKESPGVSLLSYLSDSTQAFTTSSLCGEEEEEEEEEEASRSRDDPVETGDRWPAHPAVGPLTPAESQARSSPLPPQRYSTPDILRQNGAAAGGAEPGGQAPPGGGGLRRASARRIGALLGDLQGALREGERPGRELQRLEKSILNFHSILKNDLYLHKTTSTETLAVEEVLESFDFLSTDFNADEISSLGSIRLRDTGIGSFQENTLRSLGQLPQEGLVPEDPDVAPLTTGNSSLDQALEVHLESCKILLQQMEATNSAVVQKELLRELSLQIETLERISKLSLEKKIDIYTAADLVPKAQRQKGLLALWEESASGDSNFCCSAETFVKTLRKRFIHRVKAKQPGQADAVFTQLLKQIQASCRMVPAPSQNTQHVTAFQLFNYLSRWGLSDFGEHISHLAKEVYLLGVLESPERRRALKRLKGRRVAELQPLGSTLHLLAGLQTDQNHKVARAASSCLARASGCKAFRAKAIVYYTEVLRSRSTQQQLAACLALKCLRAAESVEQVAELWQSADEDLRSAARETVLSFGKKGYLAFQRMDQIHCELQEEAYRNLDTEITIL